MRTNCIIESNSGSTRRAQSRPYTEVRGAMTTKSLTTRCGLVCVLCQKLRSVGRRCEGLLGWIVLVDGFAACLYTVYVGMGRHT